MIPVIVNGASIGQASTPGECFKVLFKYAEARYGHLYPTEEAMNRRVLCMERLGVEIAMEKSIYWLPTSTPMERGPETVRKNILNAIMCATFEEGKLRLMNGPAIEVFLMVWKLSDLRSN